jgi:hypothetical protein
MSDRSAAPVLVASLLLGACAPDKRPEPAPTAAAPEVVAPEAAVVRPAEVPPLVVLDVGLTTRPEIGAAARKANREGLEHHRAGRFVQAQASFANAIAASGDHHLARYNLACALARLGRIDDAVAELDVVLVRDPRRFAARVRGDADLDAVRGSSAWSELDARIDAALRGYDRALERGVPASFYEYSRPMEHEGRPQSGGTKNLVVGMYLHEARRFVPVSHDGEFAFVDREHRRVVRIDGGLCEGVVHSVGRDVVVTVERAEAIDPAPQRVDLDREGPPAVGAPDIDEIFGHCVFPERTVMVSAAAGLWLDLHWQAPDRIEHRALALQAGGLVPDPVEPLGPRFDLVVEGAVVWDPVPLGHELRGPRYRPPGATTEVDLGGGHRKPRWQSLVASADARFVFVTTIEHWDGPDIDETELGILRHAVTRVDLTDLRITELARGSGTARTVLGPDGALYVDDGARVRRWRDPGAAPETGEAVMDGLRLAPPLEPPDCGMCG